MAESATPDPAQLQQAIKDAQNPPGATPIEIKTETGQVFKGATKDDIIAEMKKSIEHGTATIREKNLEVERLQQQQQQTPPSPQAPVSQEEQINATYWKKWQESPMAAQNYIDSVRLGIPEEQVPNVLRGTLQQTQVSLQQQAGMDFQTRCPDFPSNNPEASNLLVQTMQQRYAGRPPASTAAELADRLEVTYGQLVRAGQLTPADLPVDASGRGGPIPSLGASAQSQSLDLMNEIEFRKLTPEQMKATIERLQAQGRR